MNLKIVLPDAFFADEKREILVDSARKKVWAILLDLLSEFDRVCKENNIQYYFCRFWGRYGMGDLFPGMTMLMLSCCEKITNASVKLHKVNLRHRISSRQTARILVLQEGMRS